MIIHPKKEVYIHIPKCGGISITRSYVDQFYKKDNRFTLLHRNWQHGLAGDYIREGKKEFAVGQTFNNIHATYDQIAPQYPDYKYFTVIRNPLDRWESLYRHALDNNFVIDWDIITWTKKAMSSLKNGAYWGTAQNLDYFEKAHIRMGSFHVMYLPAWVYYREPEVEVHRLEDQTIWERTGTIQNNHHKSISQIAPYDREIVKELIYDYYKKDFERWEQFN